MLCPSNRIYNRTVLPLQGTVKHVTYAKYGYYILKTHYAPVTALMTPCAMRMSYINVMMSVSKESGMEEVALVWKQPYTLQQSFMCRTGALQVNNAPLRMRKKSDVYLVLKCAFVLKCSAISICSVLWFCTWRLTLCQSLFPSGSFLIVHMIFYFFLCDRLCALFRLETRSQ